MTQDVGAGLRASQRPNPGEAPRSAGRTSLPMAMAVGLGVLGASAMGISASAQDAAAVGGRAPATPLVETMVSTAQDFPAVLKLRGVSEAARRVTVSAQTAGLVMSEPRRKGAYIRKGEALCTIEPGERPAQLAEAQARLLEAEAVAKASEQLGKRGFSAETTRAADRAALAAAQTAVAAIELDIRRTQMTAPFDGWLETDTAELGSLLSLGTPCATLYTLDPIHFVGFAAESEIGKVRMNQRVTAHLVDGRRIAARVSFVARAADARTRTFRVEATAPNSLDTPGGPVRDGATATMHIAHGARRAHLTPRTALMLDAAGRLGVMLAENGTARFQPVTVLGEAEGGAWIDGPPEQAEIIVTGQYYVSDGAPVRTAPRETPDVEAALQAPAEETTR
ncbi:MAG: efflux RND transporter periplasmic adaptor subunit [Pseudomonadota bacterium]